MEFVINEWLPEYFKSSASETEKRNLEIFLNRFNQKNDKIFVRRPSAFLNKIFQYSKIFQENNTFQNMKLKKFISLILLNSEKCKFIDNEDFIFDEKIINRLSESGNKISDLYLFEAASKTKDKIIITEDIKLIDHMDGFESFNVISLKAFLENY